VKKKSSISTDVPLIEQKFLISRELRGLQEPITPQFVASISTDKGAFTGTLKLDKIHFF